MLQCHYPYCNVTNPCCNVVNPCCNATNPCCNVVYPCCNVVNLCCRVNLSCVASSPMLGAGGRHHPNPSAKREGMSHAARSPLVRVSMGRAGAGWGLFVSPQVCAAPSRPYRVVFRCVCYGSTRDSAKFMASSWWAMRSAWGREPCPASNQWTWMDLPSSWRSFS